MDKMCCGCKEVKSVVDFDRRAASKDGRFYRCKVCQAKYKKKYYEDNREREVSKRRAYVAANPEMIKDRDRKRRYGHCVNFKSTMIRYDSVMKCECCNTVFGDIKGDNAKCIDHSGDIIRGLICGSCNTGIGRLGDSLEGVLQAVNYLTNEEKYDIMKETKGENV
jgi:hypothetical protein